MNTSERQSLTLAREIAHVHAAQEESCLSHGDLDLHRRSWEGLLELASLWQLRHKPGVSIAAMSDDEITSALLSDMLYAHYMRQRGAYGNYPPNQPTRHLGDEGNRFLQMRILQIVEDLLDAGIIEMLDNGDTTITPHLVGHVEQMSDTCELDPENDPATAMLQAGGVELLADWLEDQVVESIMASPRNIR